MKSKCEKLQALFNRKKNVHLVCKAQGSYTTYSAEMIPTISSIGLSIGDKSHTIIITHIPSLILKA